MYVCEACGYSTKVLTHFINHLNRKYPCLGSDSSPGSILYKKRFVDDYNAGFRSKWRNKCLKIDDEKVIIESVRHEKTEGGQNETFATQNETSTTQSETFATQNETFAAQNETFAAQNETSIICKKCYKKFKRRSNLDRHTLKCRGLGEYGCEKCEKRFHNRTSLWRHKKKCIKDNEKTISEEIKEKSYLIAENKKLTKEIERLKSGKTIINNNTNSNNTNHNNIIFNFGSETRSHITDADIYNLLEYPLSAVQRLVSLVHYNPDHPENENVKIKNIRDNKAYVSQNGKWVVHSREDVIDSLVDNSYTQIYNFQQTNKNTDEYKLRVKEERLKKLNDNIDDKNTSIRQKINREAEYVVLNKGYQTLNKCLKEDV